ncbi:hypothetical protein SCALM49S_01089 [Streptomyces californicus]
MIRWFLDQVGTRMWDVQRGAVHEYEGGYSDYVFARAERERIAATEEAKRQNLMRKELAWLRRAPPPAPPSRATASRPPTS